MILPQLVLLPLLVLFTWGYLAMQPASGRGPGMIVYDIVIITAAVLASAVVAGLISALEPVPEGSVWSTVMTTVSTFHVFPAVLLLGWYVRRRIFA